MDIYFLTSMVICCAVALTYLNHHFFKLQSTIAIMVGSMSISMVVVLLHHFGIVDLSAYAHGWLLKIDFRNLLLKGMLSYLLFAGALFLDINALRSNKWEIGILATVSTIISSFLIGAILFYVLPLFNLSLPYVYCLLFGALISPTDPIAVLATFKELNVSEKLSSCIAGESLFNDGVGIVIFFTVYQLVFNHVDITWQSVTVLFAQQALGGVFFGLLLGYITCLLIKDLQDVKLIIFIMLGIVTGGYSLAFSLGLSGPLAMVVSGIMVGSSLRHTQKKSPVLCAHIYVFWEVIDEILNALLFLLVGFELLAVNASQPLVMASLVMIPIIILVRLLTVAIPMKLLQLKRIHEKHSIAILTWGGLRGGLALALAFSLQAGPYKNMIVAITYVVVAFSIIVQGHTIRFFVSKVKAA